MEFSILWYWSREKKKKVINGQVVKLFSVQRNCQKENVTKPVWSLLWLMPSKERSVSVWTKTVEKALSQIRETLRRLRMAPITVGTTTWQPWWDAQIKILMSNPWNVTCYSHLWLELIAKRTILHMSAHSLNGKLTSPREPTKSLSWS